MSVADEGGSALLQSLQLASQSWSKFDLDSRRPNLDKSAAQTKENRESAVTGRKKLAELTKSFKRTVKTTDTSVATLASNPDDPSAVDSTVNTVSKLTSECRSTVKSYQEEIHSLTRRCKGSDSAFLNLYQALAELPDPAAVLRPAVAQIGAKDMQVDNLLRGMDEMHKETEGILAENDALKSEVDALRKELSAANKRADEAAAKAAKAPASGSSSSGGGTNREEKEELIRLRKEVAEYEVEFRGLKNQDITIRKLESKIDQLQKSGEEELKKELEKAQQSLAETEGRRATEALEREAAMERRVQSLELELRAERAGREATQAHLLEADEGLGEREAAWEAQRQILVDDAERLREQLHEANVERDGLRLRVAALGEDGRGGGRTASGGSSSSAPASGGGIGMSDMILERKAYEAEVSELSHTATTLREELQAKEELFSEESRSMQSTIDALEMERNELSAAVSSLKTQIANAPSQVSIEKMKRELRILKRLEYNVVDADAERDPEMTTAGGTGDNQDDDLETVLVAKLRKMEDELVRERNDKTEKSHECDELRRRFAESEKARADAELLVASLESDLERAVATPVSTPTTMSRADSGAVKSAPANPATLQRILDPSSSSPPPSGGLVAVDIDESPAAPTAGPSVALAEKASDDHSVATIVMAQRDRLRARCDALEAERDSFKRELQVQVQSAESLKADNTKLYEKVRYLQNFSGGNGPGGPGGTRRRGDRDRDLDLEALEQRYEASVDPFRQFSRAERARKIREMSPVERVVFIVAKTVLGSKEMRKALFVYVLGMHLLVFITTYHWSHELGCDDLHNHEDLAHFHGGVPLTETRGDASGAATGQ